MKKILILLVTMAFSGSVYAADACQMQPVRGMDCVEQQGESEDCQFICFERKGDRRRAPSSQSGFYMLEQSGMDCLEQHSENLHPEHQFACFSRTDAEGDATVMSTEIDAETDEVIFIEEGAEGDELIIIEEEDTEGDS